MTDDIPIKDMGDMPIGKIGALLDEVSGKIPKLISGLVDTIYSAEAGKKMGQAVGNLYKELLDAGIPKEDALKMAKDYMLSIKDVAGKASGNPRAWSDDFPPPPADEN